MARTKSGVETALVSFRCPVETIKRMDELCEMVGAKRSELLINFINGEYDRLNNSEELQAIFAEFKALSEKMKAFTSSVR